MRKILLTIAIAVLSTITAFGQFFTEDFNDFTWGDYTWEDDGSGGWTGEGVAKDWTFQEGFINATSYGGNQIKHWGVGGSEGDPIFAGGSGAEAKIDGHLGTDYPVDYERTARFISPIINTTGMTDLSISFTHAVERYDTYEDVFTIGVATTSDGGASWNTIWSKDITPYEGFDAKSETFTINTSDVGSDNFQICYFMEGNPYPVQHWSFDDIEMFVLPDTDVLVHSIDNKPQHIQGESFAPSVRLINLGVLSSVTFDAQYKITDYETTTVVYDETQSITLNKGDDVSVTFPAHSFSASGKVYTVDVTATVAGDANPSDNFATKEINTWTQGRQYALVESSTYLTCGSCPYAATALNHIYEEGVLPMAGIEHHTSSSPTEYTNSYAQGRLAYLSTTGAPQTYFDGINMISGGCGGDCIVPYEDGINNAMTVKSPILIGIESSETASPGVFDATVTINKLETVSKDDLRLALVLTESDIDEPWGSPQIPTLEHVNRRMYPDENGQVIDLENNSSIIKNFSIDASAYAKENCDLIAFVFDFETKEVYQTQMVDLGESGGVSVEEIKNQDILIYPNPTNGVLKIDLSNGDNNSKFQIKNIVGITLLEGNINNGNNTIDISGLSNGNYLLVINNTVKKITLIK